MKQAQKLQAKMMAMQEELGNHTVSASQAFGISVYGYGQYTSYWYPGGLNLADL